MLASAAPEQVDVPRPRAARSVLHDREDDDR